MCFSASASFTAAAFLTPISAYAVYSAAELKRKHYYLVALVPFFFGLQQFFEGLVWLSLAANDHTAIHIFSLCFIFFSHFFWPFWIPLSLYVITRDRKCARQYWMLAIFIFGTILGLIIYIPFLINPDTIQTQMHANCVQYNLTSVIDSFIFAPFLRHFYVIVIVLPFIISKDIALKWMGILIFISVVITYLFYSYAFNSVWCFFSAIISMYIVYIIRRKKDHGLNYVVENQN